MELNHKRIIRLYDLLKLWILSLFYCIFLGSGGKRKDVETARNGISKHRKATRRLPNDDDEDDDTREASRPLMKKKKKVHSAQKCKCMYY